VRKRVVLLALEVVAVTIPLTWLWLVWGREVYHGVFVQLAGPVPGWFGLPSYRLIAVPQRFINYVPFLTLMIVTPRLSPARRVLGTIVGFGLIFLGHLAFYVVSVAVYAEHGMTPRAISALFPLLLLSDSLPFILWAIIARGVLRDAVGRATRSVFARAEDSARSKRAE
jgi:hypothetical protein